MMSRLKFMVPCFFTILLLVQDRSIQAQEGFDFSEINTGKINELLEKIPGLPTTGSTILGYLQSGCEECPAELQIVPWHNCHPCADSGIIWEASGMEEVLADTKSRYEQLSAEIKQRDPKATVVLTSAYRSQAYQDHLYSIYRARQYKKNLTSSCSAPCAELVHDMDEACAVHGICKNPVARISSHGSGQAFDIQMGTVGKLSVCELFEIARGLGLSLLVECGAYHFAVSDKPQCARKCGGAYTVLTCGIPGQALEVSPEEQILGDEGDEFIPPVWNLNIGGIDFTSIFPSIFSLAGIFAPDQFGPGGPGTPPDGISDKTMQLVGSCLEDGVPKYVFSDPIRITNGEVSILKNLTYTEIPPPKPDSLTITPLETDIPAGETLNLEVIASVVDGATQDVTQRKAWTIYESSDPKVATVDINGHVTALTEGTTRITATNGEAQAESVITVKQSGT